MEALPRSKARQLQAPQAMFPELAAGAPDLRGVAPKENAAPWGGVAFWRDQAAKLLSKVVFNGSVASVTTFCARVVSSFICAERVSNCLRA